MQEYEDDDQERRLDRAIEAASRVPGDDALAILRPVVEQLGAEVERLPGSATARDELARGLAALADVLARSGHPGDALESIDHSIAASRRAEEVDPLGTSRDASVAAVHLRRAVLLTQTGRLDEALADAREAARLVETRIDEDEAREHAHLRFIAADARRHLAWLRPRLGHPEGELADRESALAHGRAGLAIESSDGALRAHAASLREISRPRAAAGDLRGAVAALAEARRLLGEASARDPADTSWTREIAATRAWTGRLLRDAGQVDDARRELDAAIFVTENLLAMAPDDALVRAEYVRRLEERGDLAYRAGDPEGALDAYHARLEASLELRGDDTLEEGRALLDLARAQGALGRHGAAIETLERAATALEATDDDDLNARESLADVWGALADARSDGDDANGSIAALQRCADVRRELHHAVPAHEHAAVSLVLALGNLGDALRDDGRLAESEAAHAEERVVARARAGRRDASPEAWSEVAVAEAALAMTLELAGRAADALPHALAALDARRRTVTGADPAARDGLQRVVCWDLRRLARLEASLGQTRDALGHIEEAVDLIAGASAADDPPDPFSWTRLEAACRDTLGALLEDEGLLARALDERDLERAAARRLAAEATTEPDAWWNVARADADAAALAGRLGRTADALARHDDTVASRERVLELAEDTHLGVRRELGIALYERAWARRRAGDVDAALLDAERSLELDREVLAASPSDRSFLAAVAASLDAVAWIADAAKRPDQFEEAAREQVAVRRTLVQDGDASDAEALGWALYAYAAALRDGAQSTLATPVAEEGVALAERLLESTPGQLSLLGLLSNVSEVAADVMDRDDPAAVARARALYARCVAIHTEHDPESIHHSDDCTCLVDNERKLAELDAP